MTRWVMVADLERCVGCQTCTAACKHANATSPFVQWRRVLDIEAGTLSKRQPHLRSRRLPALRRSAVHARVSFDGDASARRWHRHHRLQHLHRMRLLRRCLSLSGPIQDRCASLCLRSSSNAKRNRTRGPASNWRRAKMHFLLRSYRFRTRQWHDSRQSIRWRRRLASMLASPMRCISAILTIRTATFRACCASRNTSGCTPRSAPNRASTMFTKKEMAASRRHRLPTSGLR